MLTFLKIYRRRRKQKVAKRIFENLNIDFNGYKRVYHFHVRKSAGTSVNAAFWALGGLSLKKLKREPLAIGKNRIFVRNNKELIEKGDFHFANSHIPFWSVNIPNGTYTFCFFREPYERLISLYRYYKWIEEMPAEAKKTDPHFISLNKYSHWIGNSFSEFLDNLPKNHLMNQLYMFSENYDIDTAIKNVERISAVFFQHNFKNSIDDLSQTLNLELSVKRERSSSKKVSINISETEKNKALLYLAPEYDFYNIIKSRYGY